jgi:hypothetical protein
LRILSLSVSPGVSGLRGRVNVRGVGAARPRWVYIDVGWHRRTGEKHGLPPTDDPEILAVTKGEERGFETVAAAVEWARERGPLVLVRLGPTPDSMYSAGEKQAMQDATLPFATWPPPGWQE